MKDGQIEEGDHFLDNKFARFEQTLRVMAISEGYAMVRYKGAMPGVRAIKDLQQQIDSGRLKWFKTKRKSCRKKTSTTVSRAVAASK